jgi:hypothetical protein
MKLSNHLNNINNKQNHIIVENNRQKQPYCGK